MDTKRIEGLDGVRTIALLLVLIAHASVTPRFVWPGFIEAFPHLGKFGVLVFFVLSGYLQTTLLLGDETKLGAVSPRRFYAKRVLRILPLFLIYVAFIVGWGTTTKYEVTTLDVMSVLLCFKHVLLGAPLFAHFWSLSIEMLFYLCWPLLLRALPRERRRGFAIGCMALLPLTTPLIAYLYPDAGRLVLSHYFRAEAIFLGCWFALCVRDRAPRPKVLDWVSAHADEAFLNGFVVAVAAEHARSYPLGAVWDTALYFVQVASAGAMVYGAMYVRLPVLRAALNSSAARWLALVSYGTYVWQQFFFFANPNDWMHSWVPRPVLLWTFWFPCNLMISIAVGALSYYLIEKPLQPWRERLARPAPQPDAVAAPVATG